RSQQKPGSKPLVTANYQRTPACHLRDNRIRVKGTFPKNDRLQRLSINVEGQGSNIEHLFGSFVPY
ncbi:MAG: hypothetical protein ACI805_001395, partial [Candidatus Azotimanducaceae bacterium]